MCHKKALLLGSTYVWKQRTKQSGLVSGNKESQEQEEEEKREPAGAAVTAFLLARLGYRREEKTSLDGHEEEELGEIKICPGLGHFETMNGISQLLHWTGYLAAYTCVLQYYLSK